MYYGRVIRPARLNSVIVVIVCVVFVMPANHSIDALVPFMDQTFFSAKYKQTIRQEKYKLPLTCSRCEREIVDKIRNDVSFTTGECSFKYHCCLPG